MQINSFLHYLRRAFVFTAVLALGLRSLIPAGYMPDFSGHGMLTLCDGVHHHMQTGKAGESQNHHTDICPFSVGATYGFSGIAAPLLTPPVFTLTLAFFEPPALATQAIPANTPARAPPLFS